MVLQQVVPLLLRRGVLETGEKNTNAKRRRPARKRRSRQPHEQAQTCAPFTTVSDTRHTAVTYKEGIFSASDEELSFLLKKKPEVP